MKVCVDPQLCSGSAICVGICPEVFEINEDGVSVVTVPAISPDFEQACKEAASDCPTGAIVIEE